MPRPSKREERREQLVVAFERLLGELGYEGTTVAQVAESAGLSPGLVHHYFRSKDELTEELLRHLVRKLRDRVGESRSPEELSDALLALGPSSDPMAARAWVGVLAEAMRRVTVRRSVQAAIGRLRRAFARLGSDDDHALAMVALSVGFLVLGAVDPALTAGRAASIARRLRLDR